MQRDAFGLGTERTGRWEGVPMELELMETKQEAPGTRSFKFDFHETQFTYKPGQYISMQLDVEDPRRNTRSFSLASSPTESDFVMICTRITDSPFKQKLNSLTPGTRVSVRGPSGRFVLEENESRHAVLLSGGIGITPFRNMVKFATDSKLDTKMTLLYSNGIPEEIIFREELEHLQKINPNLKVINTITRPDESKVPWQGRVGRIDERLVRESVPDVRDSIFYVCGPPSMVESLVSTLAVIGVATEQIKTEKFTGY